MNVLTWLTPAAALASLATCVLAFWGLRQGGTSVWTRRSALLSATLAGASLLFLASRFLAADVQYTYVFLYTRADLPWWYRLAGTWAGREGSLLLWSTALAIVAAVWARPGHRHHQATHLVLAGAATAFLAASAWQTPFTSTPAFFLEGRPGGNGLNPTLLSPFILIHPPIMFTAYALTTVPLASSMAHMALGSSWSAYRATTRLNLLLYTAAMALGGVWAYYTLGFGGYWAWDPVEVANLLPWLALVVYIHAERHHARHGSFAVAGPLLALLPFVLTMLSTISTRSGLWVSVHAFTDPSNTFDPDPAGRFLDILAAEPGLTFHVAVLLFAFFGGLALWCRRLAADHGTWPRLSRFVAGILGAFACVAVVAPTFAVGAAFELAGLFNVGYGLMALVAVAGLAAAGPALVKDSPGPDMRRVGIPALVYVAVVVLGLGLAVLFLFHMASVLGWSEAFYTQRLPYLATPALLAITVFMARPALGTKAVFLGAAVLATALLAALIDGRWFLFVLAASAALVAGERVRSAASCHKGAARVADGLLLGAGVLNLAFWLSPPAFFWTPTWPAQFFGGALAAVVLLGLLLRVGGHIVGPRWLVPLLAAGLLGYGLSPLLVLVALRFEGRPALVLLSRLRHAAIAGIHAAVLLIIAGMALQAFGVEADGELAVGETLEAGAWSLTFDGAALDGAVFADQIRPQFSIEGPQDGRGASLLYWEVQTASHYPLPATMRTWSGDAYWNIEGVCIDPTGACAQEDWVRAFQSGSRVRQDATISQVGVHFEYIPGVGVVWTGAALLVLFVGVLMLAEPVSSTPRRTPHVPHVPPSP